MGTTESNSGDPIVKKLIRAVAMGNSVQDTGSRVGFITDSKASQEKPVQL